MGRFEFKLEAPELILSVVDVNHEVHLPVILSIADLPENKIIVGWSCSYFSIKELGCCFNGFNILLFSELLVSDVRLEVPVPGADGGVPAGVHE